MKRNEKQTARAIRTFAGFKPNKERFRHDAAIQATLHRGELTLKSHNLETGISITGTLNTTFEGKFSGSVSGRVLADTIAISESLTINDIGDSEYSITSGSDCPCTWTLNKSSHEFPSIEPDLSQYPPAWSDDWSKKELKSARQFVRYSSDRGNNLIHIPDTRFAVNKKAWLKMCALDFKSITISRHDTPKGPMISFQNGWFRGTIPALKMHRIPN